MSDNLPEPPAIVLANYKIHTGRWSKNPEWYHLKEFASSVKFVRSDGGFSWFDARHLQVVPHPRNDERAVALINGAKEVNDG